MWKSEISEFRRRELSGLIFFSWKREMPGWGINYYEVAFHAERTGTSSVWVGKQWVPPVFFCHVWACSLVYLHLHYRRILYLISYK